MALQSYGVLKGRVAAYQLATPEDLHFHLLVEAEGASYRASINVRSRRAPSLLEYMVDERFEHPLLAGLPALPEGFTALIRRAGGAAIDYIRGRVLTPSSMRPLPYDQPGPNNDLNELFANYARWAMAAPGALVYAFGEPWGPEHDLQDHIFGFTPGRGMHNIHMNQASGGRFQFSDGVWQDGALLLHFPQPAQWVAIFLKFQSQSWRSDPRNGRRFRSDSRRLRRR
jgi:uncharacterized protein YukJ